MIHLNLLARLMLVFVLMTSFVGAASAFVVEGPRRSTGNAIEDLRRAPRWAVTENSLINSNERGLGGGLEYAVDESICKINFVDGATCDQAKAAITEALGRWAEGHPLLRFTDVTGQVEPGFPLAVFGDSWQGAEIDFYASTAAEFPVFRTALTNGYTIFYTRPQASVEMTNGHLNTNSDGALESADVRVNLERCYYLVEEFHNPSCVHFPSLILHEVGHALGLGHPEERPLFNLDTDSNPHNPILIDCDDPTKGLRVSPEIEGAAVLVGRDVQASGRWQRGLTHDDAAARDALYPSCAIRPVQRYAGQWGAFARAVNGATGKAQGAWSKTSAEQTALRECSRAGGACDLVESFTGCFAYALSRKDDYGALSPTGVWGAATNEQSPKARIDAVLACNAQGAECRVSEQFCAFR